MSKTKNLCAIGLIGILLSPSVYALSATGVKNAVTRQRSAMQQERAHYAGNAGAQNNAGAYGQQHSNQQNEYGYQASSQAPPASQNSSSYMNSGNTNSGGNHYGGGGGPAPAEDDEPSGNIWGF